MINNKENQFKDLVGKAIEVFSELESIVVSVRNNFETEKKQDPRLSMDTVNSKLELVTAYIRKFEGYQNRIKSDWPLEKDADYVSQSIQSFFRKFDNPFLGSQQWYQRIKQLENILTEISIDIDKLVQGQ